MIVKKRYGKKALRVEGTNISSWYKTWPQWAKEMIAMRDVECIQDLVSCGGCMIIDGEGFMSLADFNEHWENYESIQALRQLKNAVGKYCNELPQLIQDAWEVCDD